MHLLCHRGRVPVDPQTRDRHGMTLAQPHEQIKIRLIRAPICRIQLLGANRSCELVKIAAVTDRSLWP